MLEPLHIANGHCTTRLIEAAKLPGRTSIWADALYDGPVPDVSDDELVRVRAAFIADGLDVTRDQVEHDLKQWRAVIDDQDSYDELVLWFEHDLFDQLNLIQLLSRIARERPVRKPVSLVSIDSYPGHPDFKGLGELQPADLAALFETRRPVTAEMLTLATLAWDAFKSEHRDRIAAIVESDTSALPYLAAALRRYLDESPDTAGGLTRSERRLIDELSNGPLEIHAAWRRLHEGETAYYITDLTFWELVERLSQRSPALIDVTVTDPAPAPPPALPRGTLSLRS